MEIDEGCTGKQVEDWQEKDIFSKGKKKRKRMSKGVFTERNRGERQQVAGGQENFCVKGVAQV